MRRSILIWFAIVLIIATAPAETKEVVDFHSDLHSCDVTVTGDVAGSILHLGLSSQRGLVQTRTVQLDGPGTWVTTWDVPAQEAGPFSACAELIEDGTVLSTRCTNFYYGGRESLRFDVRDFHADRRGITLLLYSEDLTVVDIYYMLVRGDKAVSVTKRSSIPISGSLWAPTDLSLEWRQILEDGEEYLGRVKIVEVRDGRTRAFMNSFVAVADAEITDTYQDETGASATVMGRSRVPFQGALQFDLYQGGALLRSIEERTPILLAGDDETVEIAWNETLDPGIYYLSTKLLGNDGYLIDVEENVIEAKIPPRPRVAEAPVDEGSSTSMILAAILIILIAASGLVLFRRRRGKGRR